MALYIDGVKFDLLATDPAAPEEGQLWYNTTNKRFTVEDDGGTEELIYRVEFTTHTGSVNPHNVTASDVGLGNVTDDAQLLRSANDFNTFANKTVVSGTDIILIEDSADGGSKKYINVSTLVATPGAHAASHEDGGGDEISVAGLSGLLADPQTPTSHVSTHEDGGADELNVAGLSGLLADPQTPTTHSGTHIRGGADAIDGDRLEVSWTGYTNYTPVTTPGDVDNTDELTAHLAGIDAKLGSASELRQKAGRVLAAGFAGNPKTATITFATAMPDTSYGVVATATSNASKKSFNITVFNKTTAGFSLSTGSNNISNLVEVSWVATVDGETA